MSWTARLRVPGFTAEATLYASSINYARVTHLFGHSLSGSVLPALSCGSGRRHCWAAYGVCERKCFAPMFDTPWTLGGQMLCHTVCAALLYYCNEAAAPQCESGCTNCIDGVDPDMLALPTEGTSAGLHPGRIVLGHVVRHRRLTLQQRCCQKFSHLRQRKQPHSQICGNFAYYSAIGGACFR